MPTELRKIVFSKRELVEAFDRLPQKVRERNELPQGPVHDVHVSQQIGGGVKVLLDLLDNGDNRLKRFSLEAAAISDALLDYCAHSQIPVARDAEKYLEVIGDNLALSQKIRGSAEFTDDSEPPPLPHDAV